ncbi:universal stress protein [Arvimicrobium flavum]|uniref:universal stress protein n=1 Tax=Arvimicrobium flavum TaxID=3393320 RepID=UPI00237AB73F|nr:universal stress protein [Mesorhizobium shangrilense]
MTYRTFLVIIQNEDDVDRVLQFAIPLVEQTKGHLIGLHTEAIPIAYSSPVGFPEAEFMQATSEVNAERAAKLEEVFRGKVGPLGISHDWRSLESFSGDSGVSGLSSARSVDLVVVAQPSPHAQTPAADVETLIFDSGRPVLIAPFSGPLTTTFKRVLVAWNASREASRAAFDALPFILAAEHTEVLVVDAEDNPARPADRAGEGIAATLRRHGANVSVARLESGRRGIDEVIVQRVAERAIDLVVLGAYSHSRLREFLFGGVTRTVLKSMAVATFMSR